MNGNEIVEAVNKLRATYPEESVEIWSGYTPDGAEQYTAYVGNRGSVGAATGFGSCPDKAAQDLIARHGKRNPNELRAQKIHKLRTELAELEAAPI